MKLKTIVDKIKNENGFFQTTNAGFSLMEVAIAISIISISVGTIYNVFSNFSQSYTIQHASANIQQNLRMGFDYMIRDMQMAGYDPSGNADASITEAGVNNLRFSADRDDNGTIDGGILDLEQIKIKYDNTTNCVEHVLYSDNGTMDNCTIIENVTNFAFTYFDSGGTITTVLEDIIMIGVSVSITEPAGKSRTLTRTLNTRIRPRNLGI